jgi:hypothetical protein
MNAISFDVRKRPGIVSDDLGDHATVEICRRVIDANLNGTPASPSDVDVVVEYFR